MAMNDISSLFSSTICFNDSVMKILWEKLALALSVCYFPHYVTRFSFPPKKKKKEKSFKTNEKEKKSENSHLKIERRRRKAIKIERREKRISIIILIHHLSLD
jgi:hypothetical protein